MSVVAGPVWVLTIVVIAALVAFDFFFHVRKAHIPTLKEAAIWSAIYVGIAIIFGAAVWTVGGSAMGAEYFSGYILEKALSVDNLFVFLVIISSFKVPREDQQKVLLFGIVFALFARSAFIFAGKALIDTFQWMFYLFGVFLLVTAVHMLAPEDPNKDEADNFLIRIAKRYLHTTDHYDGDKLFTYDNGKRVLTPMLLVMVAIGATDILFAFDSIPAIYGVTQEVYLVFTATAFSLMGLRQLYFLIDGLLDRLVYLSYGLTAILFFIGLKLIVHALHGNSVPFINGGRPWRRIPEIGPYSSLLVIVVILFVTVVASLLSPSGKVVSTIQSLDRKAQVFLAEDPVDSLHGCAENYESILRLQNQLSQMDQAQVAALKPQGFDELLVKVHEKWRSGPPGDLSA